MTSRSGLQNQRARLLRLLSRCGDSGAGFSRTGSRLTVHSAAGAYCLGEETLHDCLADRLVEQRGGVLFITPKGCENLKALLNPDVNLSGPGAGQCGVEGRTEAKADRRVNPSESPLARLHRLRGSGGERYFSAAQFAAGERLRADFERAQLQPNVTSNWESFGTRAGKGGRSEGCDLSDFAVDMRRAVSVALETLPSDLGGVALDICCFLKGFEQVERERRWPPRSAKLMLRTALAELARYYGYESESPRSPARLVHWGTGDYRPKLTPSHRGD